MEKDKIKQLVSWYLNTSDPGVASDYLDELIDLTTDQNYEFIITEIINSKGYSLVSLLQYLEEVTTPQRKKIQIYLDQINSQVMNSSYSKLYLEIKKNLG